MANLTPNSRKNNINSFVLGDSHDTINKLNAQVSSGGIANKSTPSRQTIARESNSRSIRDEIYQQAVNRWNSEEAEAVIWIVDKESSFNPRAKNGKCQGLFQRYSQDPNYYLLGIGRQINDGLDYIQSGSRNFHTPIEAKAFWLKNKEETGRGWY